MDFVYLHNCCRCICRGYAEYRPPCGRNFIRTQQHRFNGTATDGNTICAGTWRKRSSPFQATATIRPRRLKSRKSAHSGSPILRRLSQSNRNWLLPKNSSSSSRSHAALNSSAISVVSVSINNIKELFETIETIGKATDKKDEAEKLAADIKSRLIKFQAGSVLPENSQFYGSFKQAPSALPAAIRLQMN